MFAFITITIIEFNIDFTIIFKIVNLFGTIINFTESFKNIIFN